MKTNKTLIVLVLIALVASTLLTAAVPAPGTLVAGVDAGQKLVRFTVSNRTGVPITVKLIGPASYVLFVPGFKSGLSEKVVFTVVRGNYTYWVFACNDEVIGKIDLIGQRTLIVPVCGNYPRTPEGVNKVDFPRPPRMHQLTLVNRSNDLMAITFTGPATYTFFLGKGETREPIILKGTYTVKFTACLGTDSFRYTTRSGAKINFYCP